MFLMKQNGVNRQEVLLGVESEDNHGLLFHLWQTEIHIY